MFDFLEGDRYRPINRSINQSLVVRSQLNWRAASIRWMRFETTCHEAEGGFKKGATQEFSCLGNTELTILSLEAPNRSQHPPAHSGQKLKPEFVHTSLGHI